MSLAQKVNGLGGSDIPAALGHQTVRLGTGDLAAVAEVELFHVIGGDILLTALYGLVTTIIGDTGATTIQLQHTPTIGEITVDLCGASASIQEDIVGTFYTITGADGDGVVIGDTTEGVGVASFATNMIILVPGIITLDVAVSENTGVIQWVFHWIPLNEQSELVLA